MLGGSVWTMHHTCGRREAVDERGEQPRGQRGKRARPNRSQGEQKRRKENNTLHVIFLPLPTQQPQQPQQQQQPQEHLQSPRRGSSDAPTTGALKLKELVTKGELLFTDVKDFLTKFKFVNVYSCRHKLNVDIMRAIDVMIGYIFVLRDSGARVHCRL